ncbi:MAG: MerR family transcriptional regulator [Candidatus Obscuribacterales bacterium]|nr:MerR family transcriptional regulator [Candidatus Obscuribacterales bacterium]
MVNTDLLSINNVADRLQLSVHQLRRWELMFGLEIKRGRGQQRQYRPEDLSVLERIKELVEQGWPTSQIRPQLEAEGLLTPKLIGMPAAPGNPEMLQESIIGLRSFVERRFIEISKQIDELRQLMISLTLKQELSTDKTSPWQPVATEYVQTPKAPPPQEITIGPQISIDPPAKPAPPSMPPSAYQAAPAAPYQAPQATRPASVPARPSEGDAFFTRPLPGSATTEQKPVVRHSTIPPLPSASSAEEAPTAPSSNAPHSQDTAALPPTEAATLNAMAEEAPSTSQQATEDRFAIPPLPPNPFLAQQSFAPQSEPAQNPQGSHIQDLVSQTRAIFENSEASDSSTTGFNSDSNADSFSPPASSDFSGAAPAESIPEPAPDNLENSVENSLEEPEAETAAPESASAPKAVHEPATFPEPTPQQLAQPVAIPQGPQVNFGPNVSAPTPQVTPQRVDDNFGLGEVTDQNYLTVLGRALDLIGWTDEQADTYSFKAFGVPHWDELGRSQAEKLVAHLIALLKEQL